MSRHLRCTRGHEWQVGADGSPPALPGTALCPTCGGAAQAGPPPLPGTERTLSTPPRLVRDSTLATSPPAARADEARPRVPGFEVLGVLGRGGMGVVYKARQQALNRLVALKMMVSGAYAGTQERARFRAEAEAAARLQHPNIVQVYEVGEHEGHPYVALEFVSGGSLSAKLDGTPRPPKQSAALLESLSRAVHAAHAAGVVHRDLKPANVLVGECWALKVADFGLAKLLDSSMHTATGAVIGTPSYMAPEQAEGRGSEVGPAADTYALGAILYEFLTGRPPFRGTTALETLLLVQTQEPVPPSRLNLKVPRDLETICLKCLQKEPRKRYGTALDLAEDLRRFQAGEPIQARPIGMLERGVKWARRRPAVAVLLGALALSLVAGAAGMAWFALDARRQAGQARTEKEGALAAKADLETAHHNLEGAVVRSWLLPLATRPGALTSQEAEVLAEIAANRGKLSVSRFLEESLREPRFTRRVGTRSEYVVHAVVGLDPARREELERLLLERLHGAGPDRAMRTALALTLASVGNLSKPAADAVTQALTGALTATTDHADLAALAERVAAVAPNLDAAKVSTAILEAMRRTRSPVALQQLAEALVEVARPTKPKEVPPVLGEAAKVLRQALAGAEDPRALRPLAMGLSAVAVRQKSPDHFQGTALATLTLARLLPEAKDPFVLRALALDLGQAAERLAASDSAASASRLKVMAKYGGGFDPLVKALRDLQKFPGVRDPAAVKDAAQAADLLAAAMTTTRDPYALKVLAKGMLSASWSLEDKDAAALYTQAVAKARDPYALRLLARGLTMIAPRVKFDDLKPLIVKAANDAKNLATGRALALSMSEIAGEMLASGTRRVTTSAVTSLAAALDTKLAKNDPFILEALAKAMSAMAGHAEHPRELIPTLTSTAGLILAAMQKTRDPYALEALAEGLSALVEAGKLPDAGRWTKPAVASLVKRFGDLEDPYALAALARALSVLAARLPPGQAAAPAATAARALTRGMAESKDSYSLEALATGLSEVAPFLTRADAARLAADAAVLSRAMTENRDLIKRSGLADSFANLFARLEVPELVDLLGRPLCAGPARRLVLDQLGKRHKRKLADHWEFVRFAGEQHIKLDTPPKGG